jgi:hypothetical protein
LLFITDILTGPALLLKSEASRKYGRFMRFLSVFQPESALENRLDYINIFNYARFGRFVNIGLASLDLSAIQALRTTRQTW